MSLHGGMDETSLLLYLKPEAVASDYRSAPVVTGQSLAESFGASRADAWPGYLGSPRRASAALGERIWKSFTAAAVEYSLKVLDGNDPSAFPRYSDYLARDPLYQGWIKAAADHDARVGAKEREWLAVHTR